VENELKNKFVYQAILSASQVLLALITYPYITRVLGPENLGKVNYVDFLSQVFTIFAAFGISYYAVREIAIVRNDVKKRAQLIKEMAVLHLLFSILTTVAFALFTFNSWAKNPLIYGLAICNILISAFSFEWYIQGMEAFRFSAIRTISVRLLMIVGFFLLVRTSDDYAIYWVIFTVGIFIIASLNSYKLLTENHFATQPLNLKRHLKPLWHFFLTTSAISVYVYFDAIILQHLTHNARLVGYYTTVLKMVKICLVIVLAIGTVLMPRMSYLVGAGNISEIKRHINKVLEFIFVAGLPIGTGLFVLAPEIIKTVAGEKFLPAVPLMRILAFLPLIIGLSNLFCFQTLVPFKQEKKFLLVVIIGGIASLGLNFLLIPTLAEAGAAYANMTTETIITVMSGVLAYKIIHFKLQVSVIIQILFSSLLFIPVIWICRSLFSSSVLILCTGIPACMIIYFGVHLLVFKNMVVIEVRDYIAALFFKK
jgi:O-antigen/teichoic acid export membrane protein